MARDDSAQRQTGGMIALIPRAEDAETLAIAGGEDIGELHLTLTYLGEDVSDMDEGTRTEIFTTVAGLAAGLPPIEAEVMGHAAFNPTGAEGRDPCAVYLVSGTAELPMLRDDLAELASEDMHPVFLPHITAAYGADVRKLRYVGSVVFDRIRIVLAEQVSDIALAGDPAAGELVEDDESGIADTEGADTEDADTEGAEEPDAADEADSADELLDDEEGPDDELPDEEAEEKGMQVKRAGDRDEDGIPDANDPSPGGSSGGGGKSKADEGGGGSGRDKMTVASKAGEERYGLPIGTDLGNPRDAEARKAQESQKGRDLYEKMMKLPMERRARFIETLSDEDLESLTRISYSWRSANDQVVGARNMLASALGKRGKDVKDFGALGGSGKGGKGDSKSKGSSRSKSGSIKLGEIPDADWAKLRAAGWKGKAGDGEERIYPPAGGVKLGSVPQSVWDRLRDAGWKGRSGDGEERLYPPDSDSGSSSGSSSRAKSNRAGAKGKDPTWVGDEDWQARRARRTKLGLQGRAGSTPPSAKTKRGEGDKMMTLHVYEDGSWQYK